MKVNKNNQLLRKVRLTKILGPVGLAVVGFFLGGPITSAVVFLIWRTKWSNKTKVYVSVAFVAVFNLLQIIFAKEIISWTWEMYRNLFRNLGVMSNLRQPDSF